MYVCVCIYVTITACKFTNQCLYDHNAHFIDAKVVVYLGPERVVCNNGSVCYFIDLVYACILYADTIHKYVNLSNIIDHLKSFFSVFISVFIECTYIYIFERGLFYLWDQ